MRIRGTMACLLWFGGSAWASATATPGVAPNPAAGARQATQGAARVLDLPVRRLPASRDKNSFRQPRAEPVTAPAPQGPGAVQKPRSGPQASRPAGTNDDTSIFAPHGELKRFGVSIVSPAAEEAVAGRVRVTAEVRADRPSAVSAVDFFIDGRLMFSDVQAPYELLWNSGRPADHLIEVRAYGPGRQMVTDALRTLATPDGATGLGGYSARVERVELYVRVEGDSEADALRPPLFEVLENGVLQEVVAVERVAELPIAVGLLIDHSGSMLERMETALDAAGAFVAGLLNHPNDKAFVLGFADAPVVFQEFTNDGARLDDAIELIDSGRYTALYDAVVAASRRFAGVDGRRAAVLLTDGADQGSDHDLREAIAAAQRADMAIYPVAVALSPRYAYEGWVLRRLASETGGRVFSLDRRGDPEKIYAAITEDLRAQYRISYAPLVAGGNGEWREVGVRLLGEGDERRVRGRPGYFAQ